MSLAFWTCALITAVSAFVSLGFSAVALASKGSDRTSPMYAFARSLALAVASTIVLIAGSASWLGVMALTMVIVQGADAVIGAVVRDRMKTVGPALIAALNLAALIWFLR